MINLHFENKMEKMKIIQNRNGIDENEKNK
jgi:hypothetical protein